MIKTYLFTKQGIEHDVPVENWQALVSDECNLLWVDARSFTEEELNKLVGLFNFHSVAVRSCLDGYSRPHLSEFADHFYVNLTVVKRGRGEHGLRPSELHLFVGAKFVVTLTKDEKSEAVEKAIGEMSGSPAICERGPMYAVFLLAEDLVETYQPIIEDLDDEADKLETVVLERADPKALRKIQDIKRQGFELRKLLGPQRDIFGEFVRRDFPFIQGENLVYFQDVYNRMIRLFDMLDTVREIMSGSLDIYLSTISNKLNEVMKVLTVAATILMLGSFFTGFFGMNFRHLPWLESPNAFRNISIFLGAVTAGMLLWFRRKGWL